MRPFISKQGTKYKKIILVHIQVSCAIYKLAQGVNILTCSELFAIGSCVLWSGDGNQYNVSKTHLLAYEWKDAICHDG